MTTVSMNSFLSPIFPHCQLQHNGGSDSLLVSMLLRIEPLPFIALTITTQFLGPVFSFIILSLITILSYKCAIILHYILFQWITIIYFLSIAIVMISLYIMDPGIQSQQYSTISDNFDYRYCDICQFFQLNSATRHCPDCTYCIQEQYHHCSWIGKCIGKNNIFLFKIFNFLWISGIFYTLLLFSLVTLEQH